MARYKDRLQKLREMDKVLFTPEDAADRLKQSKSTIYNFLSKKRQEDVLEKLEFGKYAFTDQIESKGVYEIASRLVDDSYLAFSSALHFHGYIDSFPGKVYIATRKRKNNSIKIRGVQVEFITFNQKHHYGHTVEKNTEVSTPEKAVVDCLRLAQKHDFLDIVLETDFSMMDSSKMVDYAVQSGSSTVSSRLGAIMDKKDQEFDREKLKTKITHYSVLDPDKEKENPVPEWKIYLNKDN